MTHFATSARLLGIRVNGMEVSEGMSVTPARGQAMIREGVARAMAKLGLLRPYRVTTPIELEVGFKLTGA